jgi:hypothetical protein
MLANKSPDVEAVALVLAAHPQAARIGCGQSGAIPLGFVGSLSTPAIVATLLEAFPGGAQVGGFGSMISFHEAICEFVVFCASPYLITVSNSCRQRVHSD